MGWYASREQEELNNLARYLGPIAEPLNWALMRMASRSVADMAIVPLQDVLGLGNEGRMNTPGKFGGNWSWRFREGDLLPEYKKKLLGMAITYGRKALDESEAGRPDWM